MDSRTEYKGKLNPISLNFPDEREREYRSYFFDSSIKISRFAIIVVSVIYIFFGYLDSIVAGELFRFFILIRIIVVPTFLFVVALSYSKGFIRYWQLLLLVLYIIASIGIIIMLVKLPEAIVYSGGLVLVFLSGAVLVRLRFILFSVGSWFAVFIYIIAALSNNVDFIVVVSNGFFFIAAIIISMFAAYSNEKFNRQNFSLYLQIERNNAEIEEANKNLEDKVEDRTRLLNSRNIDLKNEIDQRVLIEKELIIAKDKAEESDMLKSAFLANMSHEIRTPMNGILGFANLLRDVEDEKELDEFIDIIIKNGEHLLNLINDIIDLSKIEAGILKIEKSEFDLNVLTKEIYDMFCKDKNVVNNNLKLSYKNGLEDDESLIYTDRIRLKQILINLVSNSCKYTDEGSIDFGYTLKDDLLKFYVKDTGIGIKKEDQKYVFDRFMQASTSRTLGRESTGLGLAITKTYLKLMGGNIRVQSKLNVGSKFSFKLYVGNDKQNS
ncbi:MAG: ATP-binding protein [Draconibacterium sp.]|nr:ATP-binding protein [Draconibacterium sp.]